ncbi:transcriptional regulator containing an amidase domain and an AraC-type DNA-binding HTH domain [Aequorivita sublithincola DSM 14238]|uniref:Transcriptional regulator containing an amidase domain and an AraC-type DNA-binding HTH domain n=1 Tax=Aequorivita sublithincola (strain DSM 14238 / LMG 21431 / ACAM 643 / 9-3) TaxID=746697 RepID=I3YWS1_AEQSU|nr:DJ-1/PfpI family protein [Aequorivita sublithincola]AFL81439.1 transcriptional regulator containing an amidase domain and an AraC-type DNA-binding HTH domain [Aequorivita sublithincola DSM 14238]
MKKLSILFIVLSLLLVGCISNTDKSTGPEPSPADPEVVAQMEQDALKPINDSLPIIGLLMYNGVLTTEVTATADVFTKHTEAGKQLFNVITIAETADPIISEEGLKITPDYTFENCPKLDVLFVPSAYDMYTQVHNPKIVDFIKEQNKNTKYTVSNCAGAQLIGASGIADGKKIVTWIGGGEQLQKDYPNLKVQDDKVVRYMEDGKFISSNGNLISYVSALNLLKKMAGQEQVDFVESYLYMKELQNWKQ